MSAIVEVGDVIEYVRKWRSSVTVKQNVEAGTRFEVTKIFVHTESSRFIDAGQIDVTIRKQNSLQKINGRSKTICQSHAHLKYLLGHGCIVIHRKNN